MNLKRTWKFFLLLACLAADIFIWYAVAREQPTETLVVAFLDVGQGDAIYIESPTGRQVMIDGGPGRDVLSELRRVMPFYDRSIDMLVITNPDADHYSGFIDILEKFKVDRVVEPGTKSSTERYEIFEKGVAAEAAATTTARRGQSFDLGGGASLRIIFPDRDVSRVSTNEGSIIAELTFGSTSVMLAGDAPNAVENYAAFLDGKNIQSTILKFGHHGSRTSASEIFLKVVHPSLAVISAGKDNRYGHPHKETTDMLKALSIPYFITYERGTVTLTSDGLGFKVSTER